MKVLYLTGMYPTPEYPQKGIFCHEQVKALQRLGVDVDVVVPLPLYESEARVREWDYEGVHIRYIRFFKLPRAYDFHRTGKHVYRALKVIMKHTSYDVIHADAALPNGYAAMLLSEQFCVPYVVHGHGLDVFLGESYAQYRQVAKIVLACQQAYAGADAIIGVSQKVLDKIAVRVSLENKGYVAYNGVDVNDFIPVPHSNAMVRFISVGNLIPLKGHDYTLRSIKALVDKGYHNIHLDILGRGYLENMLKKLTEELDISSYVTFHGYLPYQAVKEQMQMADAFVLPSYYEAFGCVYLEAMACGLPVIGCYNNGIDEVYEDGKQGFLIENKQQEQLTAAMERLLDVRLRTSMAHEARRLVETKFTWLDSAKAVLSVYKTVVKDNE